MTKKEIDYILTRLESYRLPFDHNIQNNEMTEEEIIRALVKSIEDILFSAMKCQDVDSGALIAICLMTLHEIGIITCGKDLMRFD